jgi:phosphoribosylformimino-5-aminoimidazole carboxamide ribotide isomerase
MASTSSRTAPFVVLPSIVIRQGRVVDLFQGDYAQETVYEEAAESVANRFLQEGARWIHVVDLDGSQAGSPANRALVRRVVDVARAAGAQVELGGGIRSLETARAALESGVTRVIIGTAAVERPELVQEAVQELGTEAVVVGLDARKGVVSTRGWTQDAAVRATDLAQRMVGMGVVRFVYTDIDRDSTLTGPNFDETDALARSTGAAVIASGGVTTAEQIARLARMGLEGAIVGSALYAGKITVKDALAAAQV